jgi:hypothetical protein
MKKRLVFISVFVIAFLVGSQGVILAQGQKVTVSGYATFVGMPLLIPPPVETDGEGNTHYLGVRRKGAFFVTDGRTWEFNGVRFAEIWGIQFTNGKGHMQGPVTVYTSGMEEVAWVGQFHVSIVDIVAAGHLVSGEMILEGVGDYEGMQLELHVEQTPADPGQPKYFELEGQLRVIPPGL